VLGHCSSPGGRHCKACHRLQDEGDLDGEKNCPIHRRPCQQRSEENYFFRLSRYQQQIEVQHCALNTRTWLLNGLSGDIFGDRQEREGCVSEHPAHFRAGAAQQPPGLHAASRTAQRGAAMQL
jgi:hypothetical protein